ncbi:hypothetical protein [Mucilaginibacter sp.]|uniref:hypothetical protein n=1 Tax=Mucilaginibacter sp. TaxID=1882438 RepID=UPI0026113D5B|nr:hypothetical protein [Mucilaginibacter sp.]MDB5032236.1 hypothetical protein [Mucilaginibacter sp.]
MKITILHKSNILITPEKVLIERIITESTYKENFEAVLEKVTEIIEEENERIIYSQQGFSETNDFVLSAFKGETQIRVAQGGESAEDFFVAEFH